MARKTKEETEKTFHALLEAAATLFTTQGVAATTLNDIANEANLTRGAVYWHFKGKDEIIHALWETYSIPQLNPLEKRLFDLKAPSALHDFKHIMFDLIDLIQGDHHIGQAMQIVLHNVEITENKSDLQEFLTEEKKQFYVSLVHSFTTIAETHKLRTNLNAETCALGFLCFLHGMLGQHFSSHDKVDLSIHGQNFIEIYLNGILAE